MLFEDFRKIDEYFQSRNKDTRLAHLAYAVFIDNVEAAVRQQNLQALSPSDPQIRAICQTYLTNQSLDSFIIVSEKQEEAELKKNSPWKGFGINVINGLVSNLLFGLIIFLLYISLEKPTSPNDIGKVVKDNSQGQALLNTNH